MRPGPIIQRTDDGGAMSRDVADDYKLDQLVLTCSEYLPNKIGRWWGWEGHPEARKFVCDLDLRDDPITVPRWIYSCLRYWGYRDFVLCYSDTCWWLDYVPDDERNERTGWRERGGES